MIKFDLTVTGLRETREGLEKLRLEDIPLFLRKIAWRATLKAKQHATEAVSNDVLKRRTGSLVNHIQRQFPVVEGDGASWGLPAGEKQSRIGAFLEDGGTIVPRVARMLRIPLQAAKTAAGVDRYADRPLRTVPGFFVIESGGVPFLVKRDERSGKVRFWYVLKSSVTIGAHPWFRQAVSRTETDMPGIIERSKREVLDQ